jgi:hypothetical protein
MPAKPVADSAKLSNEVDPTIEPGQSFPPEVPVYCGFGGCLRSGDSGRGTYRHGARSSSMISKRTQLAG